MWRFIRKWAAIARPGTLSAALSPVLVGLFITLKYDRALDALTAVVTVFAALFIQIAANFINDYCDFKSGLDNPGRIGPRRAVTEGTVSPREMQWAIGSVAGAAVVCGLYLVWVGGWPILLIGVLSLLCAWLYSATRYSLSYLGIAELFVLSFFGPVASAGTAYLQTGRFVTDAFWFGCVCGLISTAVLVVNNIRDGETDREAGKRTLVVCFGKIFGQSEYLACVLLLPLFIWLGGSSGFAYIVPVLGLFLYERLLKAEGSAYNRILIRTGILNLLFAVLIGFESLMTL